LGLEGSLLYALQSRIKLTRLYQRRDHQLGGCLIIWEDLEEGGGLLLDELVQLLAMGFLLDLVDFVVAGLNLLLLLIGQSLH